MKCEPSVSCGCADGTGDAEEPGDGGRLCAGTHRENGTGSNPADTSGAENPDAGVPARSEHVSGRNY